MAEKCTFGSRPPIDIHMLNEMIAREVKHFRNYKIYRPDFRSVPVTTKFYAVHDMAPERPDETELINLYCEHVAQSRVKGPHSKFPKPATENMRYGWYTTPLVKMDRSDRRFYHPKRESIHTKIEIVILMSNPKNRKGAGAK